MLDDIVDSDNSRMIQPAGRSSLLDTSSTRQPLLIRRDPGTENNLLDCNVTAQDFVVSAPDNAHPTVTDNFSQAVPLADQLIHPSWHDQRLGQIR